MTRKIGRASRIVALAAPGVPLQVGMALIEAADRGCGVSVTLECNDDVCRLGYGDVVSIRRMADAGVAVMQSPGLRVGVLIVDDRAWSFTPTPLSVEAERQGDETPNAIQLGPSVARELLAAIAPQLLDAPSQPSLLENSSAEIGSTLLTPAELKSTEKSLAEVPPLNFDLQRQVRVFLPYIQYVELSLTGASLSKHTVSLPTTMAPLAKRAEIQKKLRTTYDLLDGSSKLSEKHLTDELNAIRKAFTRPIKALDGVVMLRGKRAVLEERLDKLKTMIEAHKEKVRDGLQRELDRSQKQLHRELLPLVAQRPPEDLVNGCFGERPSREDASRWLDFQLKTVFPTPEAVVKEIKLKCVYKDVTYESLNQGDLRSELQAAFPAVPWEKPFQEFGAAQARTQEEALVRG